MGRFGFWEIAIIAGIFLLLFGAGRLADMGKGLGEGIRNFKRGLKDDDDAPPKLAEKNEASGDASATTAKPKPEST